jgi:hypothetical protein
VLVASQYRGSCFLPWISRLWLADDVWAMSVPLAQLLARYAMFTLGGASRPELKQVLVQRFSRSSA